MLLWLTGCSEEPAPQTVRLVADLHQRPGDPSMAQVPLVELGGVYRSILYRPPGCTPPLVHAVAHAAGGRLHVETAIPRAFQTAPLRPHGMLVPLWRPVVHSLRSATELGVDDLKLVMQAGFDYPHRIGARATLPGSGRDREVFVFDVDGSIAGRDAVLIVRGCPLTKQRYETAPLTVPPRGRLRLAVGVERQAKEKATARFTVAVRARGQDERALRVAFRSAPEDWEEHEVDLASWAGQKVTLRLTSAVKDEDDGTIPIALWGDPTVLGTAPRPRDRPNVLLVSLDTLRPDRLGCYGYDRPTSPAIDAELAARGAVFTRAFSAFPSTAGSHATILTSLDPCVHGFTDTMNPPPLRQDAPTLAELLRAHGYETAAFTEDGWVVARLGFARGFGSYVEFTGADPVEHLPIGGAVETFAATLHWLETHRERPWFVFVHTYQVHYPHTAPAGYLERVGHIALPASKSNLYDAEIRYTDDLLAGLLAGIERLDLAQHTLMVVLSDHGEQFGEHDLEGHANSVFDAVLRSTLILRAPGLVPAGRRIDAPVGLIDVVPTVLDLLGLPPAPLVQGRSLAPLLRGAVLPERTLWAETAKYKDEAPAQIAARHDGIKWIIDPATARGQAFDLRDDPAEERDVSAAMPHETPARILEEYRRHCAVLPEPVVPGEPIDPATREKLRALGYVE